MKTYLIISIILVLCLRGCEQEPCKGETKILDKFTEVNDQGELKYIFRVAGSHCDRTFIDEIYATHGEYKTHKIGDTLIIDWHSY